MLGLDRERVVQRPAIQFVAREDRDQFYLYRQRLFAAHATESVELRMIRAQSAPFWARLEGVSGSAGPRQTLLTVNSELEKKIDELSRANDDLRNLLISVEIGIIFLDLQLRVVRFNPAATEFLNLRKADIGRPIAHLVSRLDYDDLVRDAQHVLESLEVREIEVRLGAALYLLRIRPYRTTDNTIDGVIITIADISVQKHAQQELRKLSRAVDQSTSMIVVMDVQGLIDYANRRFLERVGLRRHELAGRPFHSMLADETASFNAVLQQVVTSGQAWQGELRHQTAGDEVYWAETTISPLTDDGGHVTHLIAVAEDVTRRKELQQTLRERWASQRTSTSSAPPMAVLVFDRTFQYILGEGDALPGIGLSETDLEGGLRFELLPSELENHFRAALRGDNIYFERTSGELHFGIQVMPVRNATGEIFAGMVVVWEIANGSSDEGD